MSGSLGLNQGEVHFLEEDWKKLEEGLFGSMNPMGVEGFETAKMEDDRERVEDHIGECGAMMVQLMSVPLPLICTGRGDNEGKNIANSHNLAATLFSRLLDQKRKYKDADTQKMIGDLNMDWIQIALYGPHYKLLLQDMLSIRHLKHADFKDVLHAGYPLLQRYLRSVLDIMVNVDMQCPAGYANSWFFENDIRFLQDLGTITGSTAGLRDNAIQHFKAMVILQVRICE